MEKKNVGCMVRIYGIVQGVGFRPHVYRKAKEMDIKGWVNNCDSAVIINAEGDEEKVRRFLKAIVEKPPELARIQKVEASSMEMHGYEDFVIKKSMKADTRLKFVLPDIATCSQCIEDIFDEKSKRYGYAFTNCTLCGPRYSIIKSLPYDRCNTTMNEFPMCPECSKEYEDPQTRRFHAQPTCCADCGPELVLTDNKGKRIDCEDAIRECALLLKKGKILGIKGIGGFHLACNALDKEAVSELRKRKRRKDKPLALMMKDIGQVRKYCEVSKLEEEILAGNKRPIVLLKKKDGADAFQGVAPKMKRHGVMLPYAPLHHLLFHEQVPPLVMTSGNISKSPIEYCNQGALKNISGVVDYFLVSNRDINTPVDDSVVKVVHEKAITSRPGRGYAPYCIQAGIRHEMLACGAGNKSTFSFSSDGIAYMSQYLGDLSELKSYEEYVKCMDNMKGIFGFHPEAAAFDMHPGYMSTVYGEGFSGIEVKVPVQHHHAHMASCMLEHDLWDNVLGIIYDGTGLGLDGTMWGGEFLIGNRRQFKRVAHFKYARIQGGDSAAKDIWKIGVSYLKNIKDEELKGFGLNRIEDICKRSVKNTCIALDQGVNCHYTSSAGRLFDAVCSILGIQESISYDAQGAIELESIAEENVHESYDYSIGKKEGMYIMDCDPMIMGILKDARNGEMVSRISAKFHNAVAEMTVEMACRLREEFKIGRVVLSGGVFENACLLEKIHMLLKSRGFAVFFNEAIPANDSGISLGQIAVADEILNEKGI